MGALLTSNHFCMDIKSINSLCLTEWTLVNSLYTSKSGSVHVLDIFNFFLICRFFLEMEGNVLNALLTLFHFYF